MMRHQGQQQLDMPEDMQLQPESRHPGAYSWTEIGEAQVTHTIFGRARVRVVRKHDRLRRLLAVLLATAVVAAAWVAIRQPEPPQSPEPATALGVTAEAGPPAPQAGYAAPPAAPLVAHSRPDMPSPAATGQQAEMQKRTLPPAQKGAMPEGALTAQPLPRKPPATVVPTPTAQPASDSPAAAAPKEEVPAAAGDKQAADQAGAQP